MYCILLPAIFKFQGFHPMFACFCSFIIKLVDFFFVDHFFFLLWRWIFITIWKLLWNKQRNVVFGWIKNGNGFVLIKTHLKLGEREREKKKNYFILVILKWAANTSKWASGYYMNDEKYKRWKFPTRNRSLDIFFSFCLVDKIVLV